MGRAHALRARLQRRRRRSALLATGAAVAVALAFEFSVASFGGMSLAELLDQRSPGTRTAGVLTKTKLDRSVLADRLAVSKPAVPKNLAEVLAPPVSALAPTDLDVPVTELASVLPPPPGAVLLPPP